ncbi:hypothetical protein [Echinicola pacifica]|nr:hypothetical protein [Echinicola pacifica]
MKKTSKEAYYFLNCGWQELDWEHARDSRKGQTRRASSGQGVF